MDLSLAIARLKAQVSGLQNRVYGAAELAVVLENPEGLTLPCACVIWAGDEPLDQSLIPGQQARFREEFSVVLAVNNTVEARGATAVAEIETLAGDVKDALVGWAPSASHSPCAYAGSAHGEMNTAALIHEFRFGSTLPGGTIFSAAFSLTATLKNGVTVATFAGHAATMLEIHIGGSTRLTSDYAIDREAIPESATRYQMQIAIREIVTTADVNLTYIGVEVRVFVYHHLAPSDTERTYTETTLPALLDDIMVPSNWRLASVRTVDLNPSLSLDGDVGREG